MKKHLAIILLVVGLLVGVYIVGHPNTQVAHKAIAKTTDISNESAAGIPTAAPFDKTAYSRNDPVSIWVVVNKKRPLAPINYAPTDLTSVGNGQFMRAEAATALSKMVGVAKTAGYSLIAESGYRSYNTQVYVYNNEVSAYGQAIADSESARPGYSEHQTGWAVDIGNPSCYEDCFGKTAAAPWILANSYKYGFIRRYPADKSGITGYREEPWHFRYVGTQLSEEMHKDGVQTLEEFFGLPAAPNY